jgi:4-alpha-glucanotransferase
LADAQKAGRDAGMHVGLIADLAVGTDGSGSHAWSRQQDILMGVAVGAPPDLINTSGQNWGLTSFSPRALRQHGFLPFLETLRATLRHAGGARIDHVLGLQRLWLVPEGARAKEGAYLRYPVEDMLRLITLESLRHRAIIIGEDLGTVPEGFQQRLAEAGVMGMRVLWFERDHGFFVDPSRWSARAMATTSTHDLATVAGWWSGRDIDWRVHLQQGAGGGDEDAQRAQRAQDRRSLWAAFEHAQVAQGRVPAAEQPTAVVDAAIRFVARTPAPLAIVPIEDLLGLTEQPNLPGTTNEHPNWRRRLPGPVDTLLQAPAPAARMADLREERLWTAPPVKTA